MSRYIVAWRTDDGNNNLHTVNTSFDKDVTVNLVVDGKKVSKDKILLADSDPITEIDEYAYDKMKIKEIEFSGSLTIPKASVCVVCFEE